jgi:hypothetical protein
MKRKFIQQLVKVNAAVHKLAMREKIGTKAIRK